MKVEGGGGGVLKRKVIRAKWPVNQSLCGQSGVTTIKERFRESLTLNRTCLRRMNGGKA